MGAEGESRRGNVKRPVHIPHLMPRKRQILQDSPLAGFDLDAVAAVDELAVAHIEAAQRRWIRAESDRRPLRLHPAVGDGEILVGPVGMQGLRADRVVAAIEIAARDAHIPAAVKVQAVAVASLPAADGDALDGDVLACTKNVVNDAGSNNVRSRTVTPRQC